MRLFEYLRIRKPSWKVVLVLLLSAFTVSTLLFIQASIKSSKIRKSRLYAYGYMVFEYQKQGHIISSESLKHLFADAISDRAGASVSDCVHPASCHGVTVAKANNADDVYIYDKQIKMAIVINSRGYSKYGWDDVVAQVELKGIVLVCCVKWRID